MNLSEFNSGCSNLSIQFSGQYKSNPCHLWNVSLLLSFMGQRERLYPEKRTKSYLGDYFIGIPQHL